MRESMSVLHRPVVSEKTYRLMDARTYVFEVDIDATKVDVRHAVEEAFGVKVAKVNTMRRKGKTIRNRRTNRVGHRDDTKRAIVTLAPGNKIELYES